VERVGEKSMKNEELKIPGNRMIESTAVLFQELCL
jgi:hypothetical protein